MVVGMCFSSRLFIFSLLLSYPRSEDSTRLQDALLINDLEGGETYTIGRCASLGVRNRVRMALNVNCRCRIGRDAATVAMLAVGDGQWAAGDVNDPRR